MCCSQGRGRRLQHLPSHHRQQVISFSAIRKRAITVITFRVPKSNIAFERFSNGQHILFRRSPFRIKHPHLAVKLCGKFSLSFITFLSDLFEQLEVSWRRTLSCTWEMPSWRKAFYGVGLRTATLRYIYNFFFFRFWYPICHVYGLQVRFLLPIFFKFLSNLSPSSSQSLLAGLLRWVACVARGSRYAIWNEATKGFQQKKKKKRNKLLCSFSRLHRFHFHPSRAQLG